METLKRFAYCFCCFKDQKYERDETRKQQEEDEADVSGKVIREFNQDKSEDYAIDEKNLPAMGSRLQKYWFQGRCRDGEQVIVTLAPLSMHCQLILSRVTLDIINDDLLPNICLHPFIQPLHEIYYHTNTSKLLSVHPLCTRGSLRDTIYQNDPIHDWSKKYVKAGRPFSADRIAKYGRQLLSAITFLYKQGFPLLGHVHAGNIFISEDNECCRLGGYENTLLGYRTRLYRQCVENNCVDRIDVIMFGHVIYMMSFGRELNVLIPEERHYQGIEENLQSILRFIFSKKIIKSIMEEEFFKSVQVSNHMECKNSSSKVKKLLKAVSKGGRSQQPMTPYNNEDKSEAQNRVENFLKDPSRYSVVEEPSRFIFEEHLPDIGRRKQKYWSTIKQSRSDEDSSEDEVHSILYIVKVPGGSSVSIDLNKHTLSTIQQFLTEIEHPYLMKDMKIHYLKSYEQVIVIQPLIKRGSLRDKIQGINKPFTTNWSSKLTRDRHNSLSSDEIRVYGQQILEALWYLYQQGFPPLGHVHTGNIYLQVNDDGKEACLVGGYENTLLGYDTTQRPEKYSEAIDIIMFGHVIFELGSGFKLDKCIPSEGDYEMLKGSREVLEHIFKIVQDMKQDEAMTYRTGLEQVMLHKFFNSTPKESHEEVHVSKDMKQVLTKVRKPLDQLRGSGGGGALGGVMESVRGLSKNMFSRGNTEIEMVAISNDKS